MSQKKKELEKNEIIELRRLNKIGCPKCNNVLIGETISFPTGFTWFTCYKCDYKSNNKEEFLK